MNVAALVGRAADYEGATGMVALVDVGVVVIGRNEGARFIRCLESLPPGLGGVVYVDSGSTDGSVFEARRRGVSVVELDTALPFTAARARNAGLARLRAEHQGVKFVQFVDGDCSLVAGWIELARRTLVDDPTLALVCGRRREVAPDASIYNRLCDLEWDTPVGDALSCGGDALARLAALEEVGDYDASLIAGEEPEMCARLRAAGWRIRRLESEMTRHDANMHRFWQWWRRTVRSGHARAEVSAMHPPMWRRELRSIVGWGGVLPAAALLMLLPSPRLCALLLLGYPALAVRVLVTRRRQGARLRDAALYGVSCAVGKLPAFIGVAQYAWNRRLGRRVPLIEYK